MQQLTPSEVAEYDVANGLETLSSGLIKLLESRDINIADSLIVGIRSGGLWLAEALGSTAAIRGKLADPAVGALNISFYRDDFTRVGLHPRVAPSSLPFSIDDRHIVLVDDVIQSGRTIRAAMNELFDFGRPASITLVCLCDVGERELPVQPDLAAVRLQLPEQKRVKLRTDPGLRLELAGPSIQST